MYSLCACVVWYTHPFYNCTGRVSAGLVHFSNNYHTRAQAQCAHLGHVSPRRPQPRRQQPKAATDAQVWRVFHMRLCCMVYTPILRDRITAPVGYVLVWFIFRIIIIRARRPNVPTWAMYHHEGHNQEDNHCDKDNDYDYDDGPPQP